MALENDIQELTAAVKALTAALGKQGVEKQPEEKAEVKKPAAKPAAEVLPTNTDSTVAAATQTQFEPVDVGPEVTLQHLVEKFTDLVDFNRSAAVALLKEYGLPKLGQAKPEQYVELFNKTCELLNG